MTFSAWSLAEARRASRAAASATGSASRRLVPFITTVEHARDVVAELDEVIDAMEKAEEAGKMTVRLHTGDPAIYGAIREQMDRLDEKKIAYDVCPGVSSFVCQSAVVICAPPVFALNNT